MRILRKEKRQLGSRRVLLPLDKTRNVLSRRRGGVQEVRGRRARTKTLGAARPRGREQVNLLQSDVFNARAVLSPWGIPDGNVSAGWHNGEVSVIVVLEADEMTQEMLLSVLENETTISIPVVFKKPESEKFKFNFDPAS